MENNYTISEKTELLIETVRTLQRVCGMGYKCIENFMGEDHPDLEKFAKCMNEQRDYFEYLLIRAVLDAEKIDNEKIVL